MRFLPTSLALLLVSVPASATIFSADGKDPRRPQPQTGAGRAFSPIGVVSTDHAVTVSLDNRNEKARTSANIFMISPCYALTNFHAVFGLYPEKPDMKAPPETYSVSVSMGASGNGFTHTAKGRAVVVGEYWKNIATDYAVIKLDDCIGANPDIGWLDLKALAAGEKAGAAVEVAGFYGEQGFGEVLYRAGPCHLLPNNEPQFPTLTNCPATHGSSAAPIFVRENGHIKVVAIIAGGRNAQPGIVRKVTNDTANRAVDMADIFEDIPGLQRVIEKDIAAHGGIANPSQAD